MIRIEHNNVRMAIAPELGAGVASFDVRTRDGAWRPLLRPAPPGVSHFKELACYTLAPWSNRIPRGEFRFAGRRPRVRPDWPDGTAIHGLVKDRAWSILDRSPVSARLALRFRDPALTGWEWPFDGVVRYELGEGRLLAAVTLTNRADSPMPAGCGFHPYFLRAPAGGADDARLIVRTEGRYPAAGMIPTGPARADALSAFLRADRALDGIECDDVFAGFDGRAEIAWPAAGLAARFDCSPNLGHAVLYAPERSRGCFCLEPVSMVNDGFNRLADGDAGTGVVVLEPGASLDVAWGLTVSGPAFSG